MDDSLSVSTKTELTESRDILANDYQKLASSTAIYPDIGGHRFVYPIIGLADEAGEVAGKLKKLFRDDDGVLTEDRRMAMRDELGDVAWYLSEACTALGLELGDVLAHNIDKLYGRKERGVIQGDGDQR